jgi:DhnA family fructose-bisphosphate aldolase class Ia
LVHAGADIIQTEGGTSSQPVHAGTLGLMEKAAPTLAAAYEISRAVAVPVLCASGLSSVTVPLAISAGASGVGVGSAINQLNSEIAMIAAVRSLVEALTSSSTGLKVKG